MSAPFLPEGLPLVGAFPAYRTLVTAMTEDREATLRAELAHLRQDHRDLDAAIAALVNSGRADHLQIQRLKKRKLALKDRISTIEDKLLPDIIA